MRTLNVRLLAILFAVAILTGAVGYGVHDFQVRRNAGVLLEQAEAAKKVEDWNEAMDCLQRYVSLVPRAQNGEALADLGLLQADARRYVPALKNLQEALRRLPERKDVQRRLVDVAIAVQLYSTAIQHLDALLKDKPTDADLLELHARCQTANGNFKSAVDSLNRAIEADPNRLESYALLAAIYEERLQEGALAREILDQMIAKNESRAKAFVIRGTYRIEHQSGVSATGAGAAAQAQQSLAEALQDARSALDLEPDDEDTILYAVRCLLANRQADEARRVAEHGRDLFPNNPTIYALLADVELQTNHRAAAIDWLEKGVQVASKQQQQDLLWNLCNLSLEEGNLDAERLASVRSRLDELRRSKYPNPPLNYLEARLLTVQRPRQWLEASIKLERNRAELVSWSDLLKQSDYLLGRCYEALGNPDLQLAAYRRAASVDPLWIPARLGVAGALYAMGNIDESLNEYREIARVNDSLGVWLQMTRVMVIANLRRKPEERNWDVVLSVLDQIEQDNPNSTQVTILRAEVLLAQEKNIAAVELLQAARDRSPQDLELWLALAAIAEQREDWNEAARILAEAQAKNGDAVPLRLARARMLVNQAVSNAHDELLKLAVPLAEYTPEQTAQLQSGIAALMFVLEDYEETARLCREVARIQPSDLLARLMLFDTAIRASDWSIEKRLAVMSDVLKEMQEIGGKSPLWNYGMAVELRIKAQQAEADKKPELQSRLLREARQHLAQAGAARRDWSRVPLLLAEISRAQGDEQTALDNYLEAIKRGEQNPAILATTVNMLYQQGKVTEADDLIRRLDQQARSPFSNELVRMATEISLQLRDPERALDLATNRFRARNAGEHMWAGQVFRRLGKLIEAETSFRKAVEIDETQPEPWIALVQFLGMTDRFDEAAVELQRAEQKINPTEVASAISRCIEFTGKNFEEMEKRHLANLANTPNDFAAIRRVVDFYLRQKRPRSAEPLLQQVVSGESSISLEDRNWARRNLALAMTMSRRDRASIKRALGLLDENLRSGAATDPDRRSKALVLAMLPEKEPQLEAADLLERLLADPRVQDTPETAEERFLLAQLYMKLGDNAKVTSHMRTLLATHGDVRRYVEPYAAFLTQRGEVEEAKTWLTGLERGDKSQQQDAFTKLSFSVEGLFVREKYEDVLAAVDVFVGQQTPEAPETRQRIRRAATILEGYSERLKRGGQIGAKPTEATTALSVRFLEKSEELYRKNAQAYPAEALSLAAFCSRHAKLDEAIQLLDQNWSAAQPGEITAVTITLMISPTVTPQQLAAVEKILRAAIDKFNRQMLLVQALADLQSWREEYDEAEELYRESLSKGDHPLALNNLALLLALRGKGEGESMKMIEKAISLVGSDPSLLDTRATINLVLGLPQLSVSDLIEAISKRPSPLNYFHQAQVLLRLGQKDAAKESLSKAQEIGLQVESLHPLERKHYQKLQQELR